MRAWVPGARRRRREREDDGALGAGRDSVGEPGVLPLAQELADDLDRRRGAVAAVPHHHAHLEPRGDGDDGAGDVEDGLPARGGSRGEEGEGEEAREAGQT